MKWYKCTKCIGLKEPCYIGWPKGQIMSRPDKCTIHSDAKWKIVKDTSEIIPNNVPYSLCMKCDKEHCTIRGSVRGCIPNVTS